MWVPGLSKGVHIELHLVKEFSGSMCLVKGFPLQLHQKKMCEGVLHIAALSEGVPVKACGGVPRWD